jgi:hypothetical protein
MLTGPGILPPPRKVSNMQLASIPKNVLVANQQVAGSLATANDLTVKVQAAVGSSTRIPTSVATDLRAALDAATQAREGVEALGGGNLLDDTFQRYSSHAVRDLTAAVEMLDRKGPLSADGLAIFTDRVFDAEVATRLGTAAGERSLAKPSPKALLSAQAFAGSGSTGSSSDNGPVWVDGQWLDGLGNPVRGGDSWTGPDGQGYGWDGSPVRGDEGGGYTGPDGETYSGI